MDEFLFVNMQLNPFPKFTCAIFGLCCHILFYFSVKILIFLTALPISKIFLKTIQNKNSDETFRIIQKLIQEWEVSILVVGLPTHPDGAEHEMTRRAKRFGNQLNGRLNLPVKWVDERYSSAVVDDPMSDIDRQAAVLILEQYFQENPN